MAAYVWIRDKKCVLRRVSECGAGSEVGLGTARIVYVVFAFEPYILHECGQWQPVAIAGRLPASFSLSVCVCVSFNIIAYLRAA